MTSCLAKKCHLICVRFFISVYSQLLQQIYIDVIAKSLGVNCAKDGWYNFIRHYTVTLFYFILLYFTLFLLGSKIYFIITLFTLFYFILLYFNYSLLKIDYFITRISQIVKIFACGALLHLFSTVILFIEH